jgi:hypothetical protein
MNDQNNQEIAQPLAHPSHRLIYQTQCEHQLLYCEGCDIVSCTKCKREWMRRPGRANHDVMIFEAPTGTPGFPI